MKKLDPYGVISYPDNIPRKFCIKAEAISDDRDTAIRIFEDIISQLKERVYNVIYEGGSGRDPLRSDVEGNYIGYNFSAGVAPLSLTEKVAFLEQIVYGKT